MAISELSILQYDDPQENGTEIRGKVHMIIAHAEQFTLRKFELVDLYIHFSNFCFNNGFWIVESQERATCIDIKLQIT